MFKLNQAITARAGATLFATVLAGASAWSEGPSPPQFRNGRACWDRLCPVEAPIKSQSSQKSATPSTYGQQADHREANGCYKRVDPTEQRSHPPKTDTEQGDRLLPIPDDLPRRGASTDATRDKPTALRSSNARSVVLAGSGQYQDTHSGRVRSGDRP
jgi:hypothetical protein